jgi:hypothetical protein
VHATRYDCESKRVPLNQWRYAAMKTATLIVCLLMLLISGCTTVGRVTDCAWAEPILLAPEEIPVLSEETKRQILAHNETGARLCGW